jgi:hypothetical protein
MIRNRKGKKLTEEELQEIESFVYRKNIEEINFNFYNYIINLLYE